MGIQINGQTDNISAVDGSLTISSGVSVAAGTTAAPSISPSGDSNTGIFFPKPDTIAFAEGGIEAVRFDSSGRLGIGTINPQHKLSIYGTDAVRNEIVCTNNNAGGAGVYLRTLNGATQVSNATLRTTNDGTFEVYTGTSAETVKLSVDTSGNLITPNNIGGGLDIGYKKFVNITGSYSANTWYNTGIDRTTDTGIYLLNAFVDTYFGNGQSYQMTYTGLFALPNRNSNSGDATSITLHRAGHAPNAEVIQFRTLLTGGGDSKIYLQWLSNFSLSLDGSGGKLIQVAIHRLTTAFNN